MTAFVRRRGMVVEATLAVLVLSITHRFDPLREGLSAVYLTGVDGAAPQERSRIDSRPSTDSLRAAWGGRPPVAFSTTWTGSLLVLRGGRYVFGTASDDGSRVYIDRRLVVDNWGRHTKALATGSVALDRGVHAVFIEYVQAGGDFAFELSWARAGAGLAPVPAWAFSVRDAGVLRILVSLALRRGLPLVLCLWLGAMVVVAAAGSRRLFTRWVGSLRQDPMRLAIAGVVAGSFVLNVVGVWWGVPGFWAGDEITPDAVYSALTHRFSAGWWDRYPPLHFVVLSLVAAPSLALNALDWIHLSDRANDGMLLVFGRLVSVAAAAGTLVAVYVCGARAFTRRAGLFGAAMVAVLTPFVYYAKTANPEVPYVFWFTVSLVFYARFLQTLAARDLVIFAAAASASMCTKDQAYGLYLVVPCVIVCRVWQDNREQHLTHPFVRAVGDVRVALAAATVALVFVAVYALPFNVEGLIAHLKDITGPGRESWRMFEPTLAGRLALLRLSARLDQQSWGWPLCVTSVVGLFLAMKNPQTRRVAVCLALVCASYYIGFINLVLYSFDRYLLPICIVQALFGGVAIDRFLSWSRRTSPAWRIGPIAGVFAYTVLYAATVDVLMVRDSRYVVEQWLRDHVPQGEGVGSTFPQTVLPRLDDFPTEETGTIEDLRRVSPAFFILNADYARAVAADTATGQMIDGLRRGTLGYRMVHRYRAPAPWPWLPGAHPDLVGRRLESSVLSVLRNLNPTIEVYARAPSL